MEFRWQDKFGLAGKEPFTLAITGRDDEAPSLACEDLPRQKVVLDTELLELQGQGPGRFRHQADRHRLAGHRNPVVTTPAKGERILAAGGHRQGFAGDQRDVLGASRWASSRSRSTSGSSSRTISRAAPRVYSPTYTFYVLNAEQHAIWVTEQLSKWHRQSLEVRDQEMQLYETNKQLRALAADELDRPETRRKIENQAAAERANGRRLSGLVVTGEDLIKQAMRNPEFGIGHLEKWAEMLQILKDIAGNRMPSVADLLKQAAQAPSVAMATRRTTRRKMAGQIRAGGAGVAVRSPPDDKPSRRRAFPDRRPGIVAAAARRQGRPSGRPRAAARRPGSRCP